MSSTRTDIDNNPIFSFSHMQQNYSRKVKKPSQVRVDLFVNLSFLHPMQRSAVNNAGIVDQYINSAISPYRQTHSLSNVSHFSHVAFFRKNIPSRFSNVICSFNQFGPCPCNDYDLGSFCRQQKRNTSANSSSTVSDNCYLAVKHHKNLKFLLCFSIYYPAANSFYVGTCNCRKVFRRSSLQHRPRNSHPCNGSRSIHGIHQPQAGRCRNFGKGNIEAANRRSAGDLKDPVRGRKRNCRGANGSTYRNAGIKMRGGFIPNGQTFPTTLANAIFDKIYYKKYSCDFLQCLSNLDGNERFTIIITELGNRFFASSILPLAAATAAGIVLLAVSIRTWYGIAKSIGVTCIIVGLPYFTFPLLEQMLTGSQFATTEQSAAIQPILAKVFEPMKMNFLLVFIFGVVLAVVGFVGGYFVTRSQKKVVNEEKRK